MGDAGERAGQDRPNAVLDSEKSRGSNGNGGDNKVGWRDLPNKGQLVIITLARLSEPLVQTSLQSYVFYQLKWFDPSLPEAVISGQAGVLHASYMAVQVFTAVLWGRVADAPWAGRKTVIMIGLTGRCFGFATTFYQALFFRCLAGLMNANVGVMRTVISEIVREKKYQPQAFLLLPMAFNMGILIGPILGGFLADPAESYPSLFGSTAFFVAFPFALPNIVSAAVLASAIVLVWLCLDETLDTLRSGPDLGRRLSARLGRLWTRTSRLCHGSRNDVAYTALSSTLPTQPTSLGPALPDENDEEEEEEKFPKKRQRPAYRQRLPFRRLFTRNVVGTLAAQFALALHLGAFSSLLFLFLATPVFDPAAAAPPGFLAPAPPFRAAGGLGLPAAEVGLAMALLGALGIGAQLLLYPRVAGARRRHGGGGPLVPTVWSWRLGLALFPAAYVLAPLLTAVPSTTAPPGPKTGPGVWAALAGVLGLQVLARTFALPAQAILLNNSVPHPSVLATLHGLGQSAESLARALGPAAAGWLYGAGLAHGLVGAVFWGLAAVAAAGLVLSFLCREGGGHEIRLEGDDEGEDENKVAEGK